MDLHDLEEWHRVWFAYLIHCPKYREYIERVYHNHELLDSLPDDIREIGEGYSGWTEHLLPEVWSRLPRLDDFISVWSMKKIYYNAKEKAFDDFIDDPLEPIVQSIKHSLPEILEKYKEGEIATGEAVGLIETIVQHAKSNYMHGFVVGVPDPHIYPKSRALEKINNKFDSFPDLRAMPPDPFNKKCPVRYTAPNMKRMGDLSALKKQITWYVLSETYDNKSLVNGIFSRSDLPFGVVDFTGHRFEKKIQRKQLGNGEEEVARIKRHKRSLIAAPPADELRDFSSWVGEQVRQAKKVMSAVALGYFPSLPDDVKM